MKRQIAPINYFSHNQRGVFLAGALHLKGREGDDGVMRDGTNSSKAGTTLKEKKKKNTSPVNKRKSTDEIFWHDENDEFTLIANNGDGIVITRTENNENTTFLGLNENKKSIKFTIRGNPRPLVRHRTSRGFMYNPSQKAQESFRDSLLKILPQKYHPTIIDDISDHDDVEATVNPTVFFPPDEFLEMSVKFRIKRPLSHFVGNKPGHGRIRPNAPGKLHNSRSDVDNLAKFVMDSLNEVLYVDDRQVVSLKAIKVLDSDGLCRGATEVFIRTLEEDDIV
eukprot:CAMPEP_0171369914 /NCGR_PEP_ID=MMETSP0879-20121228/7676_1 /TAXON_ID=67004 /ORGANISM="Thalassiosira weissflogii, Strain CCMP1336" /LENGTH=279 /DNA_ID=CAMNT_0011878305 /DNA_START=320 /DNA_END=1159 /DNA_ORIENTATION=-